MSAARLRQLRNAVAASVRGNPSIPEWLDRLNGVPELAGALEGLYCGEAGEVREPVGDRSLLIVQWYRGRVEVAYLS